MLSPKENSPLAVRRTQSSASRAIRNRQAQRMFRQRQDSRLEQLRQSASGLSVQLSQLTHRMRRRILDDECEIENIKQAIERLRSLDGDGICADCVACIAGPANLMPTHPNSADGRHGPLQVTSYVNAFSNLPSLRGSRLPHELMDAIRMFSKSGDPASAKRRFAQFFKVRRKLLDCCSVVDRQMAIEIIEQFKTDNKDHVAVMYELSYADGDIPIPADSFRDDELGFVVGGESQLKCTKKAKSGRMDFYE
ncbi:hypothetical protein HDU83_001783 [Entophlyctis luteolus]|nr:hypothetical protein HDU83_001783 [Entophlyctis luteolus]